MALEILTATVRNGRDIFTGNIPKAGQLEATIEVPAASNANSTFTMFRIPANARIKRGSVIQFDDLASSGSPTLDIGFKAVDANITTDVDALNDGIDAFTSATGGTAAMVKDHANWGKQAWEYVSGQTSNPGGFLDLTVTILDAAANSGGTLSATLVFEVD
jgi:hypothetical protein